LFPQIPSKLRLTLARIFALVAVIVITIYVYTLRDRADQLEIFGYPGIFILSFLAYATVLLPAPGVAVVFTMGAVFNPIAVGIAAGAGAALGELTGYLAGFSSQAVIERANVYDILIHWMRRNGPLTILILSAIPNPFFDMAGLAAGALKMPVVKFFFWCLIGETIKMTIFALAGMNLIEFFE
jgi:membrane protein YqaA with SNARE-associated domain